MNQDNDNEFWSRIGETLQPRLTEAHWTAQRARVMSRLAPAEGPARLRPWVAAAALACLAGLWLLLPGIEKETKVAGPTQAPAAASLVWDARVTVVQGEVTVFSRGNDEGVPAVVGMPLDEGDHVRTGADGRAELALSADSVIDLGPVAAITLSNLRPQQTRLNLDLGTLVAKLSWKGTPGRRLDVETPTAVAAVRGTEFGVTVEEGGDTSVGVFDEGKVAVQTKDVPAVEETVLMPRQEVHVPKGAQVETESKEGRSYLRVGELAQLKPYEERIERVRERPEALGRDWKEMARPERELVRGRMIQEHRGRMQALPPEERQSMMERLRRPVRDERAGGGQGPGSHDGGRERGGPGGQRSGRQAGPGEGAAGRPGQERGRGAGGQRAGPGRENRGQDEGRGRRDGGGGAPGGERGGRRMEGEGQRRGPGGSDGGGERYQPGGRGPGERGGPGEDGRQGRRRGGPGGRGEDGGQGLRRGGPGRPGEDGGQGFRRGGPGRPEDGGRPGRMRGGPAGGADGMGPGQGPRGGRGGGGQTGPGPGRREGGGMRPAGGERGSQGGQNRRQGHPRGGRRN